MIFLRRLIAGACLIIAAYFGAAVLGAVIPGPLRDVAGEPAETVLLVAGPIHYDILLPLTPQTRAAFAFLAEDGVRVDHPDARWLVVGWGSRAFYTTTGRYSDLDAATIWTAATGDSSVLRFEVLGAIVPDPEWPALTMSETQVAHLRGAVLQEIQRYADGVPVVLPGVQLSGQDVFFAAQGRFSVFRTCNVWVGDVLRQAGVRMGFWTPTPYAVTLSRWWFS